MGKIDNIKIFLLACCSFLFVQFGYSQGLEDVIVETYYISDANDATDTDGGSLVAGSTTYRVFIDMAAGYELQAVYGNGDHTLRIETTTEFFNNEDRGEETGDAIGDNRWEDNTVAVDSWVSLGAATDAHFGVLKSEDGDGSLGNGDGFMQNNDPLAGVPISSTDGLIPGTLPSGVVAVGLDLSMFADANDATTFSSNSGAWSVLEGVSGPTASNTVLVAQITTNGDFSFELNVQLGAPDGSTEQYVASNAIGSETVFPALNFPVPSIPGCTDNTACNYDAAATDDDGSCIVPVANCSACNGTNDGLVIIDTDSDGVCDADEIPGCTDASACNYDMTATDEDGSCVIPVANCSQCNGSALEIIDADGDGVCDADEVAGCMDAGACNYNMLATDDDGSCLSPVANCSQCNGAALEIIDTDGDGVCDADEVPGCTDANACNYDATADSDDGSCALPVANCSQCNGSSLEIIDTDGDGICDADEIGGCTDAAADNYNPGATDEDGSCTYGVVNACDGAPGGLEGIIVETYYIADANDASDTDGGGDLAEGATTYRVYVDMAPGYEVQAIYGNGDHTLSIGTTTEFFNNEDRGEETGDAIGDNRFDENTVALDSWVSLGAATNSHLGVLKVDDNDGTLGNADGFLQNNDAAMGLPLTSVDGMIPGTLPSGVVAVGLDLSMFADANSSTQFSSNGGAWSVLEGVSGPTSDNHVLIAQITTDGDLSFQLNVQIGAPDGSTEQYVATNALAGERQCGDLTYPGIPGCTDDNACNYDANATIDNGSCIIPVANCSECNATNDGLDLIDSDSDGVCDADEAPGCTNANACNYDFTADTDDGSCIVPVANCSACNATNDGLVIIDSDGDGICDADEVAGCTDIAACNYNALATDEDGSCVVPTADCTECNATNDGLDLIDADGDGVCDADEQEGCQSATACNYDPLATDDDGLCIEPVAGCTECDNGALVLIDADDDGICDADEIAGCTDAAACNYDAAATDDDASCIVPEANCTECNATNDGLDLIDTDGDGTCDADENPGCNNPLACNYDANATGDDGSCIVPEANCTVCIEVGYGSGWDLELIDADGDGVCDADEVLGCTSLTACNYDPAATESDPTLCIEPVSDCYACNSTNDGLDIIDTDSDGICDGEEIPGCTSATACNYNANATDEDGSCLEPVADCLECGPNGSLVLIDPDGDGVCTADEVPGCMSSTACNYDANATDDDGSCLEPINDCYVCNQAGDGLEIVDADGDGICNAYEIDGCTSETACNYNPDATDEDNSCIEPTEDCTACFYTGTQWILVTIDTDLDGICDADEVPGCMSATACNYNAMATDEDGTCIEPVANCMECNATNDGLDMIDSDGDGVCDAEEVYGCTSATACNYDANATEDNGSCMEPVADCLVCYYDGMHWQLVLVDSDGDGVCDANDFCDGDDATGDPDGDGICTDSEIYGCTDASACNYDANATEDDWSCIVPVADCVECNANNDGLVLVDSDGDGVCDANEVPGCMSATACNYDPAATDNDGSCIEPVADCMACNSTNDGLEMVDTDSDGVCDANEVYGCTNVDACNFDANATEEDGSCLVPIADCLICNATNDGLVIVDTDGDGTCNAQEVDGCTSPSACNFDPAATEDDGTCIEPDYGCTECNPFTGLLELVDSDGDGICNDQEVPGCTSATACNYDPMATDEDGTCVEPVANCTECYTTLNGVVLLIQIDSDGDGVCDADEVPGCTNSTATNYDPLATDDDGSCILDCLTVNSCESFEGGFNGWVQVFGDDIDWTSYSGSTPSFYTGPESAFDGSEYVYIEASYPNYPNKNAQIVSPCYELGLSSSATFAYHMQGVYDAVGSLSVDVSTDGGANWTSIWYAEGHQGTEWNEAVVDLSAYTGMTVKFRLSGTTANSWKGDIAVDNFCVIESIYGCTDPQASNYNAAATVDDGSCTTFTCAATVSLPYCESFESGMGDWAQSATDNFDWTLNSGGTASWGTGPSAANDGMNYIYAEASHPNYPFKSAIINTPCFDLSGATNPSISFDYHMYGSYIGSIYLQASTDGVVWDYLWWETGNQGDNWLSEEVSLAAYAGSTVQLRLIGQTAHGWQGDLAIDNVCVDDLLIPSPAVHFSDAQVNEAVAMVNRVYNGEAPLQEDEFTTTEVSIYPNPTKSNSLLNIDMSNVDENVAIVNVIVSDLMGRQVFVTSLVAKDGSVNDFIGLPSEMSNGTYFIQLQMGDVVMTEKLIINN